MDNVSICVGRSSLGAATRGREHHLEICHRHIAEFPLPYRAAVNGGGRALLQFLQNGIVAIAVNTNRQRFPLCQTLPFPTRYKINIKGKKTNLPHFAWLKRLYKYALTTWGYIYLQNVHPCPRHSPSIFCQQAPGELWGCDRAWLWIFSTFIIGPEPPHSTLDMFVELIQRVLQLLQPGQLAHSSIIPYRQNSSRDIIDRSCW